MYICVETLFRWMYGTMRARKSVSALDLNLHAYDGADVVVSVQKWLLFVGTHGEGLAPSSAWRLRIPIIPEPA